MSGMVLDGDKKRAAMYVVFLREHKEQQFHPFLVNESREGCCTPKARGTFLCYTKIPCRVQRVEEWLCTVANGWRSILLGSCVAARAVRYVAAEMRMFATGNSSDVEQRAAKVSQSFCWKKLSSAIMHACP